MKSSVLALTLLFATSCATRRPVFFRVLPAEPAYLLRSPNSEDTPFPEVLRRYTDLGPEWVSLRPEMGLRVENAYFREGAPRYGMAGFVGTEVAQYRVQRTGGLRLISVEAKVAQLPKDQAPVQDLIQASLAGCRYHRFFYQIVFPSKAESRNAVLLSAASTGELDQLGAQLLSSPDSVCGGQSAHCTVFPEACTVSIEMEIVVNGAPRSVLWGIMLASIVDQPPRRLALLRMYAGHLVPVKIDRSDRNALRLPLLPGDHLNWE